MNENHIKSLIKLTNFRYRADEVFDNPMNTLKLIQLIAEDYEVCVKLQEELYEKCCFKIPELMKDFEMAEIQMGLYKIILAELPKYL